MVELYVSLIIKGARTLKQVPVRIREQVRQLLIELDLKDLIEE